MLKYKHMRSLQVRRAMDKFSQVFAVNTFFTVFIYTYI